MPEHPIADPDRQKLFDDDRDDATRDLLEAAYQTGNLGAPVPPFEPREPVQLLAARFLRAVADDLGTNDSCDVDARRLAAKIERNHRRIPR